MPLGEQGQYFYSPDILVYINSLSQGGIIDVSEDIMSFQVTRQVNQTSTASITLANKNFKYTPDSRTFEGDKAVINTMDPITIFLKREKYLQCFTGFVTYCPIATLIPSPIEVRASCTLYKLEHAWWDSGSVNLNTIIPGNNFTDRNSYDVYRDGGAGIGIFNVLTQIANFPANNVHISALPDSWTSEASLIYSKIQNEISQNNTFYQASMAAGMVSGKSTVSNKTKDGTIITNTGQAGAPGGTGIPGGMSGICLEPINDKDHNFGFIPSLTTITNNLSSTDNTQYNKIADPNIDDWWISVPFPYWSGSALSGGNTFNANDKKNAAQWLSGGSTPEKYPSPQAGQGRLMYLENTQLHKGCYVRVCFASPTADATAGICQTSW